MTTAYTNKQKTSQSTSPFFLLIDDAGHRLLIDDAGNELLIQGASTGTQWNNKQKS